MSSTSTAIIHKPATITNKAPAILSNNDEIVIYFCICLILLILADFIAATSKDCTGGVHWTSEFAVRRVNYGLSPYLPNLSTINGNTRFVFDLVSDPRA